MLRVKLKLRPPTREDLKKKLRPDEKGPFESFCEKKIFYFVGFFVSFSFFLQASLRLVESRESRLDLSNQIRRRRRAAMAGKGLGRAGPGQPSRGPPCDHPGTGLRAVGVPGGPEQEDRQRARQDITLASAPETKRICFVKCKLKLPK